MNVEVSWRLRKGGKAGGEFGYLRRSRNLSSGAKIYCPEGHGSQNNVLQP